MKVTVKNKTPLVVLPAGQRRGGRAQPEFRASGGVIAITPKPPTADREYTPEQRRAIDAQLDKAAKGSFYGPFDTADEMIAHIKGRLKKRAATKSLKRSR